METKEIECGNCGAPLPYVEGVKAYKCEYCETTTVVEFDEADRTPKIRAQTITIDASKIGMAVKDSAQTAAKVSVGCILFSVILAVGIVIALIFLIPYSSSFSIKNYTWDGTTTLACGGNEVIHLNDKTANIASGPAIRVTGSCRLTCENCKLKGNPAIEVSENGKATCLNCDLSGPVAASAGFNGQLKIDGGTLTGTEAGVRLKFNGELEASSVAIRGRVGIDAAEGMNPKITLKQVTVDAVSVAFELAGNSKLNAQDTKAEAATGIRADGNTRVTYSGGSLEAESLAVDGSANSRFEFTDNAQVTGEVKTSRRNSVQGL